MRCITALIALASLTAAVGCESTPAVEPPDEGVDMGLDFALREEIDASPPDMSMLPDIPVLLGPDPDMERPDISMAECGAAGDPLTDSDRDGLSDSEEQNAGSNPCDHDSDGDGFIDLAEVRYGGDPWDPTVGVEDYLEIPADPGFVTLDVVFQLRLRQADIVFVLDSTGSMGPLLNALAGSFANLVARLAPAVPDATYGIADYRDYVSGGFAGAGDYPFRLRQQLTTDVDRTQEVFNSLQAGGGGDGPESTMEALYQALTGRGYDQNCNRGFDPQTDVRPFRTEPGDIFDGLVPGTEDEELPGTGKIGGVGFRRGAFKIIVYGTDAPLRDPDRGDPSPGGCPADSGSQVVIEVARRVGVKLVGVALPGAGVDRMQHLADETASFIQDGDVRTPLVLAWENAAVGEQLIDSISRLLGAVRFEEVRAEVIGDPLEVAQGIAPPMFGPVEAASFAQPRTFRLELDALGRQTEAWQLAPVYVGMFAEDGIELARRRFLVAVPPR